MNRGHGRDKSVAYKNIVLTLGKILCFRFGTLFILLLLATIMYVIELDNFFLLLLYIIINSFPIVKYFIPISIKSFFEFQSMNKHFQNQIFTFSYGLARSILANTFNVLYCHNKLIKGLSCLR